MNFYTIDATQDFALSLAQFCDEHADNAGFSISDYKIFVPTRRSVKIAQDAFLRHKNGQPRLLPQIDSVGDADLTEAALTTAKNPNIKPAISSTERTIILARLLEHSWPHDYNYIQALAIADDLGRLIDQIHTENLDIKDLENIIDARELAQYWEMTSSFLINLLGNIWPDYLNEINMIDPGHHRRLIIESITEFYATKDTGNPVIIAGSTGSIPSTRQLIKTIAQKPYGMVILPALDRMMDDKSWRDTDPGHPQYLIKYLLDHCQVDRKMVAPILNGDNHKDRLYLASEMMRPAKLTDQWKHLDRTLIANAIAPLTIIEADNDHEEATAIALSMLETLSTTDNDNVVLITPDRTIAKYVQQILKRWHITIDDSAGWPLTQTTLGHYAMAILATFHNESVINPISLLESLKNTLCGDGGDETKFRNHVRSLENVFFRGVHPPYTFSDLKSDTKEALDHFCRFLEHSFTPLITLSNGIHSLSDFITAHITVMETLSKTQKNDGATRLWVGQDGESMAQLFQELMRYTHHMKPMSLSQYADILDNFMARKNVTSRYGTHPRLSILGQIEARIVHADRVILAGLNEKTWPSDNGFDVWMSEKMRGEFGLPSVEQKTTLSAHDFTSAFCAKSVFITRSKKSGGQPTIPSRWLQRMDTILRAVNISPSQWPYNNGVKYLNWAKQTIVANGYAPITRPMPKPSVNHRPLEFSATEIEKWMRDPYWIYAKKILKLSALDPISMPLGPREKGNIIHDAIDRFTKTYPDNLLPDNAYGDFIDIGRDMFDAYKSHGDIYGFWWPQFLKSAKWYINTEQEWRAKTHKIHSEVKGQISIPINGYDFILKAKADRIETRTDDAIAVVDYKTGGVPASGLVNKGIASQLVIETLIIDQGGFDMVDHTMVTDPDHYMMQYWVFQNKSPGGEIKIAQGTHKKSAKSSDILIKEAMDGLTQLMHHFSNPNTAYIAQPNASIKIRDEHNDYLHLSRVGEWSVTGGNDE